MNYRRLAACLLVALLAASCSTTTTRHSAATKPSRTRSASVTSTVPSRVTLSCDGPIGSAKTPQWPATLNAVALNKTNVQGVVAGFGPYRYWFKSGLNVRVGTRAQITVPPRWRGRLAIGWGTNSLDWTTGLTIPACGRSLGWAGPWIAYPGGFSVRAPACVSLIVRAGGRVRRVHVSLGVRC